MTTRPFKPNKVPATVQSFAEFLASHKPESAKDIIALGYELVLLSDEGKFRRTYEVLGHECIIKIPRKYTPQPNHEVWRNPKRHSQIEVETIRMVMEEDKYEHLRRYVPQVYYSCLETGVVVMPVYRTLTPGDCTEEADVIGQMFRDTLKKWTADYTHKNIMRDGIGNLVVVDLGY